MKYQKQIQTIVLTFFIAIFIIGTGLFVNYNDTGFFRKSFTEFGAYDKVQNVDLTFLELKEFLDGRDGDISAFTESEQAHLTDVKNYFAWLRVFFYISIIVMVALSYQIYKKDDSNLKAVLFGSATPLILITIIGLFSLISFDTFWNLFHIVLFPQGNYMFAHDSLLITLFPPEFFARFVFRSVAYSGLLSLGGLAIYQVKS